MEELCRLGAHVYTCARSEDDLNRCLREWEGEGFSVKGSTCDVSHREERVALFQRVSSCFDGKLNILASSFLGENYFFLVYKYYNEVCMARVTCWPLS